MFQQKISEQDAGQRFDRYLAKLLPKAGNGFLHKMLRKKNITLNGKRADGSEKLCSGDVASIFFAQETLEKFMGKTREDQYTRPIRNCLLSGFCMRMNMFCLQISRREFCPRRHLIRIFPSMNG